MKLKAYRAYIHTPYRIMLYYILPGIYAAAGILTCILYMAAPAKEQSLSGYCLAIFLPLTLLRIWTVMLGDRRTFFGIYRKDYLFGDYMKTSNEGAGLMYRIIHTDLIVGLVSLLILSVIFLICFGITEAILRYPISMLPVLTAQYIGIVLSTTITELFIKLWMRRITDMTLSGLIFTGILALYVYMLIVVFLIAEYIPMIASVLILIQAGIILLLIHLNRKQMKRIIDQNWLTD